MTVSAGELVAAASPADGRWSVYLAGVLVGELVRQREVGHGWLVGRIRDDVAGDLVAEGPTALAVLRRLALRRELAGAPSVSPVRA